MKTRFILHSNPLDVQSKPLGGAWFCQQCSIDYDFKSIAGLKRSFNSAHKDESGEVTVHIYTDQYGLYSAWVIYNDN